MFIPIMMGSIVTFIVILAINIFSSYLSRHSTKKRTKISSIDDANADQPNTNLPNGVQLYTNGSWIDIKCVYREIFEWECYCNEKNTDQFIQLKENSTVFDIGSNIGMFAVYLARRFSNVRVHCFEPLPETYALCEKNLRLHAGDRFNKSIFSHQIALSNRDGEEVFMFNPFLSMAAAASSQHEAMYALGKKHGLTPWIHACITDMASLIQSSFLQTLLRKIANLILHPFIGPLIIILMLPYLIYFVISSLIHSYFFDQRVSCKLQTLSNFLNERAADVTDIDLLKLDVEGSEMDVLDGINEQSWKKIHQMAIEVHDVNGRLEAMKKKLIDKGFEVKAGQEDWQSHKLLEIYTVFARRPKTTA